MEQTNSGAQSDRLVREIHAEVSGWNPTRGPRWNDLLDRAERSRFALFRTYAFAGAALAAVIVAAYMAMAGLGLGSFATAPVESHSSVTTNR